LPTVVTAEKVAFAAAPMPKVTGLFLNYKYNKKTATFLLLCRFLNNIPQS